MAGEIVKARKNLKELREEIVEVSRDLGTLREETDALRTERARLTKEIEELGETVKGLLKQIAIRLDELRRLGVNIEDSHDVASRLGTVLTDVETKWKELEERFDSRTAALNLFDEDIKKKEELLEERQTTYDSLGREIEKLLSDKAEALTLLAKARDAAKTANDKRQQIMATIHEAMARFKVFERRIARFSKDTGYVVGYPRPEKLLEDNEQDHG